MMSCKHNEQKCLKRKQNLLDQTTNDFEDEQLSFRYPKNAFIESNTNESKRRGRSRNISSLKGGTSRSSQATSQKNVGKKKTVLVHRQKAIETTHNTSAICEVVSSSVTSGHSSPSYSKDDFSDLDELEKSVCSSAEKLCPSCRHIVLMDEYTSHVSTCLQRFTYSRNEKDRCGEKDLRILPCPVCLKTFTSASEKHSHVKICGLNHGLSTEKLILAARLQEKQDGERVALGLPSPRVIQHESGMRKKPAIRTGSKKSSDPDLELAFALSRSLAQEETEKRAREEDKLVSLGLHDVVQENRRKLVLPQPPPIPASGKGSRLGKSRKKGAIQTTLMTRTKEERERIITEKVAAILTGEMDFVIVHPNTSKPRQERLPCPLNRLEDKESTLWNFAGTGTEVPLESYFIPEFEEYIKPQSIPVGELLKSYSKVPGRMNYTALAEDSDEEEREDNEEGIETTIVDAYCTQLVLAEMLCTQELDDFTFSVEEDCAAEKEANELTKEVDTEAKSITTVEEAKPCDEVNVNVIKANEQNDEGIKELDREVTEEVKSNQNNNKLLDMSKDGLGNSGRYEEMTSSKNDHDEGEENLGNQSLNGHVDSKSVGDSARMRDEEEILLVDLSSGDETASTCSFHSDSFNPNDKEELTQPERPSDIPILDSTHSIKTLPEPTTPSTPCPSFPTTEKIFDSQSSLHSKLLYEWSCLLASGDHSDIDIITSDGEIPVHFLVLFVRCPEMLKDLTKKDQGQPEETGNKKCIKWLEVSYESAYAFVVYLYSGFCAVKSKASDNWLCLFDLSIKYKCTELVEYLESVYKGSPSKECTDPLENAKVCVPSLRNNSPVRNSKNGSVKGSKKLRRSHVTEFVHSQSDSPDIFGDWDSGEPTRNFIDSPNVTPPGSNIRESLLKSLKSPVLNLDNTMPLLDKDNTSDGKEIRYNTMEEKRLIYDKQVEKGTSSILGDKETSQIIVVEKEANRNTFVEMETTLPQFVDDEETNLPQLEDYSPIRTEKERTKEGASSVTKPALRRNLSYEFKELDSPPRNLQRCDSPVDENIESGKLQLSPFSDLNYASGNEIVDLTLSSDNSDSDGSQKILPQKPSPNYDPEPASTLKEDITNNDDVASPTIKSFTSCNENQNGSSRFSALLHKPIQNRVASMSKGQYFDCELNSAELSPQREIYNPHTEELTSKYAKEIENNITSSLFNGLISRSKNHEVTSELHQSKSSHQSFSDESLLKAVCTLEDDITVSGKGKLSSKTKSSFRRPQQKFFKSKSCTIASSSSLFTPDKRDEEVSASRQKLMITPLPDYKTMLSPELKKELDKYGIRKLSRKKAVTLLLHIYEQMHPLVTDSEAETSFTDTPLRKETSAISENDKEKMGRRKRKGREKSSDVTSSPEVDLNASLTSNTSAESGFECLEETVYPDSQEDGDAITPTQQTSLDNRIKTFIRSDSELYSKILCYEPIWANELNKELKLNGIKCSIGKLIAFLDEQCITFRLPTRDRTRKRQRKNSSPNKIPRKRKILKTK